MTQAEASYLLWFSSGRLPCQASQSILYKETVDKQERPTEPPIVKTLLFTFAKDVFILLVSAGAFGVTVYLLFYIRLTLTMRHSEDYPCNWKISLFLT